MRRQFYFFNIFFFVECRFIYISGVKSIYGSRKNTASIVFLWIYLRLTLLQRKILRDSTLRRGLVKRFVAGTPREV